MTKLFTAFSHPQPPPRMFRPQNIPLFPHRYVGINFRDIDGTVPKHFLDKPNIHISLQKARGKGVAEHMRSDVHFYGCEGGVLAYHPSDGLIRECLPGLAGEKAMACLNFLVEVFFIVCKDTDHGLASDLDPPLFSSLAIDKDGGVMQIHVAFFQGAELGYSHAGGK